ncbi:hypothetical protein NADE_004665 [Nannochloris sp. 'desiccata']|nr:hypothetical protein NADE_004664 [Chlorella desiccata (nom. nud.)]KAH7622073.1 hypothetical protein NADE_004665 [Chlorella desiccata (nom. nud.)]
MVTRIRSFNAMPTNTAVQFQTGDIRLYTHLHLIALLQQLIDLHTNIFEQFGVAIKVFEFVDDAITITIIFRQYLLYKNITFYGISGIYPSELLITLSNQESTADFLDITLSSKNGDRRSPLRTTFYTRFSKIEFPALLTIRYVHNSSNLGRSAKDNILTERFHALRRNLTDRSSFWLATANVTAFLTEKSS